MKGRIMRRRLPLGVLAILVLAVASLPAASASSSQADSSAGKDKKVEVIRLTAVPIQETELDLGEPGESLGDQLIFTEDLFRDGKKVGIDGGVATVVRFEPEAFTLQFVATAELPKGEITVQGLHTFTEEDEPQEFAITGGTGRYKTAHGVLTVVQTETGAQLTFRVIR